LPLGASFAEVENCGRARKENPLTKREQEILALVAGGEKQSGNCTNIVHCSGDCAGSRARDLAKVRSAISHSSSSAGYSERIGSRRTFGDRTLIEAGFVPELSVF